MTDVHTPEQRSFNMSRIKAKDTALELRLRRGLRKDGIKSYRVTNKLVGKPDLVFPSNKVAVFIDGCFWHRCPEHFIKPSTRIDFWVRKIDGNVKRDRLVDVELKKLGWYVLRLWEHEIRKNLISSVDKIGRTLKS